MEKRRWVNGTGAIMQWRMAVLDGVADDSVKLERAGFRLSCGEGGYTHRRTNMQQILEDANLGYRAARSVVAPFFCDRPRRFQRVRALRHPRDGHKTMP